MDIQKTLAQLDSLARAFKRDEIEPFLASSIKQAMEEEDSGSVLVLVNELVGFYREINEYEKGILYGKKALGLIEDMGLSGTVHHATTLINLANGLRAAGQLSEAISCYRMAGGIYENVLEKGAFEFASLYNNLSLVYMESRDFDKAEECQRKALTIVEENAEGNGFELGVSHTNLGNTLVQLRKDEEAKEHLLKAKEIFDGRHLYDTHYGAAVMGLGELAERQEKYDEAMELYQRGMQAVIDNYGVIEYFYRIKERYDRCLEKMAQKGLPEFPAKNGLTLCEAYYRQMAEKSLSESFPSVLEKAAIGLIGRGSECYGFDDIMSRDHDWGPGFCIWLLKEDYDRLGSEPAGWYDGLEKEFCGIKRAESAMGGGRVGILCFEDFVADILGEKEARLLLDAAFGKKKLSKEQWLSFDEVSLSCLTNGKLFSDRAGFFTQLRSFLAGGYPYEIKRLLLAQYCASYSQTIQYNFRRMALRGDAASARMMLSDGFETAAKMCYLVSGMFAPHKKWLINGADKIVSGAAFKDCVELVCSEEGNLSYEKPTESSIAGVLRRINELTAHLVTILEQSGFISRDMVKEGDVYMEDIAMELLKKTPWFVPVYSSLRSGEWDEDSLVSYLDSQREEDLPEMIAALEFDAFDEVKNEGGRASCQDNWNTFSIMRKSQYSCWSKELMVRYALDFMLSMRDGWNPITEKYGRMEESTAPEEWEKIKDSFPVIDEESKAVIEAVTALQVGWMEEFAKEYPDFAAGARAIHTSEDTPYETSYETYLRGELSTYSPEMLGLYAGYVAGLAKEGKNLARMIMEETARLYGYASVADAENAQRKYR